MSDLVLTMKGQISDGTHATDGAELDVETDHNPEGLCIFDEPTMDMDLE